MEFNPGTGAGDEYAKQHLVPFAETIPMRSVARLVSPFVDRFQQDMVPGERPGVLDSGGVRLGVGLCYDVAYDDVFEGAARQGRPARAPRCWRCRRTTPGTDTRR